MDRQELFNKVEAVGFALYDTALFLTPTRQTGWRLTFSATIRQCICNIATNTKKTTVL